MQLQQQEETATATAAASALMPSFKMCFPFSFNLVPPLKVCCIISVKSGPTQVDAAESTSTETPLHAH